MNITELARKLKITPNELKEKLPELGFSIGKRAIQIPDQQAIKVIEAFNKVREEERKRRQLKEKIKETEKISASQKQEKIVYLPSKIQVFQLAKALKLPLQTVFKCLLKNGITASLNENLDFEIAAIIAEELGFKPKLGKEGEEEQKFYFKDELDKVISQEPKEKLVPRPPVVVIMGHVDHGKTTLLSAIYEADLTSKEPGAITQHIGAYQVERKGRLITFIDTPGHVAFENMRVSGGRVADIAILVVAADDGIQPQTLESIKIIQEENLPFIVAINKIDLPGADVEKVKKQLAEINLMPEDFGGKTICTALSAKTKKGIPELLDLILLVADMEKDRLLANPSGKPVGTVIESHLDTGFGPVATAIIFNGTLKTSDNILLSRTYGTVRMLKNWRGEAIKSAGPSTPVQIFNFKALPLVGDILTVERNQETFRERIKKMDLQKQTQDEAVELSEGKKEKKMLFILRADTFGTLEAVSDTLKALKKDDVDIQILKKGVGNITESDIILAGDNSVWVIGFNTGIPPVVSSLARERGVKVSLYKVIYELIKDVEEEIKSHLSGKVVEKEIGEVEIKACFSSSRKFRIIGGKVTSGKIIQGSIGRVFRDKEPLAEGKILELQVNKETANQASKGEECGIKIGTSFEIVPGDILKVYQQVSPESISNS